MKKVETGHHIMKKIKKLIILIIFVLLFGMLHRYTEEKFKNDPPKGVTEQLVEWIDKVGH
ncbi:hypothetical protein [Faecalispora jeddahensis]|uniref:hypothetical protein n=1 Tax=Faecalispora jeddahensis TaxID=1414721 RepID=UPI00189A745B|nr:hypothetical protein [Faecalispora jeddahensis]